MPIWVIVLVVIAFCAFVFYCVSAAYFLTKASDPRREKRKKSKYFIPHGSPVVFDECRMPQGIIEQLKMWREMIPPMIVKVKAVKQPPLPLDEQTREELKKILEENSTMVNEEAKAKIDFSLKHKAESLVNLIDMFVQIELGRITCSDEIRDNTQALIKDICEEIFNVL